MAINITHRPRINAVCDCAECDITRHIVKDSKFWTAVAVVAMKVQLAAGWCRRSASHRALREVRKDMAAA